MSYATGTAMEGSGLSRGRGRARRRRPIERRGRSLPASALAVSLLVGAPVVTASLAAGGPPRASEPPAAPPDAPSASAALTGATAPLRTGERIELPLAAGEEAAFAVELGSAPAWRVVAVQDEVDVVLEVRGPEGGPAVRVDGPVERLGPESILLEGVPAGRYEVRLEASDDGGRGRVSLLVEELPAADPRADDRRTAEAARSRAGELAAANEAEASRQALAAYREAAAGFDRLGASLDAAWARLAAAYVARRIGDTAESLELSRAAAQHGAAAGDAALEGWALNSVGLALTQMGRHAEAREELARAGELHEATGSLFRKATSLNNVCLTWHFQGALDEALPCYLRSLELFRSAGEPGQEALVLNNVGGVHHVLAEPEPAMERYRRAVELHRAAGDARAEAETLNNLAVLHVQLGEYQEALLLYERMLDLQRRVGDRRGEARTLNNLGAAYVRLGEAGRALGYYEQALPLRREVDDRRGEAATLNNLGRIHRDAGEPQRALELHRQALEIQRQAGERGGEGSSREQIGRALVAAGRPAEAIAAFDEALATLAEVGDRAARRRALAGRAEALLAAGDVGAAEAGHLEALALSREILDVGAEVSALGALAAIERRTGRLAQAEGRLREAIELVESLRARVFSPDLRASYGGSQRTVYEQLVGVLMDRHAAAPGAGHDRRALAVSEQARARTLLELVLEGGAGGGAGADGGVAAELAPELGEARRSAVRRLSAKARLQRRAAERGAPAEEVARLGEEVRELLAELDAVEARIRSRDPRYAELVRPPATGAAEVQALLDPGTVLIEYALGDDRSFAWRVTREAVEAVTLPGRATLDAAARRAHEELSGRVAGTAVSELAALALEPLGGGLAAAERVVVVPDGALHYVPFAALPLAGEPLLVHAEVVHLPSVSVLAVQRRELADRPAAPRALAVLADPVFDVDDLRVGTAEEVAGITRSAADGLPLARLRMTRREAEAIASHVPAGDRWLALDFAASRQAVLEGPLGDYRIVHFATHGVLDTERPGLSGLVLARVDPAGRPTEGFLNLHDVYGLSLRADLVVLSGCQTALGREVRGEGLIGLTRGFMHAGAGRVIASLWQVQDLATAELMERFYRAMIVDGSPPAAALREAQLAVRSEPRWRDPYFWAGFVLQGDWRGPPARSVEPRPPAGRR